MAKIKKLQDGYTSIEQSDQLLELGVPEDSADCYYEMSYRPIRQLLPDGVLFSELPQYLDDEDSDLDIIPCWSGCRLIEIYKLCFTGDCSRDSLFCDDAMEVCYNSICSAKALGMLDFSKLED